jgi:hypothetical protein
MPQNDKFSSKKTTAAKGEFERKSVEFDEIREKGSGNLNSRACCKWKAS